MSSRLAIAGFLGLAAICPGGTVDFGNLADSSIGSRTLVPDAQYQSFFNTSVGLFLTDVKLLLAGNNADPNVFSVGLYSDSSTSPGPLLDLIGSMSDSALTANCNCIFDFPVTPFALSANTRYWIGLSTTNGSVVDWSIEGPFQGHPGDIGVTGEFIDDTGTISSDNGEAFQMQITVGAGGASTPEPSSLLLGAAGLIALAVVSKRRFSHSAQRSSRAATGRAESGPPSAF